MGCLPQHADDCRLDWDLAQILQFFCFGSLAFELKAQCLRMSVPESFLLKLEGHAGKICISDMLIRDGCMP